MTDIKFSVSMCVYGKDNPEWFQIAVESILNQTIKPTEVVLVVDGPVPQELDAVITHYEAMPIFKVIRFAENRGHGDARRAGLEACTYDLVAIMDADDISAPDRFEKQLAVFDACLDVDVVGGNITEFVGEPEHIVGRRVVPQENDQIYEYMKKRCPMNLVTVMFKKSSVQAVGGFIDWYCEEDYYLWIRMFLAKMRFVNVLDDLVNVRVGAGMYQRRGGIKYFKSEARIQRYMLRGKLISFSRFLMNVGTRLILQVILPSFIRGWVFQKIARD